MHRHAALVVSVLAAGCSNILGIQDLPDAGPPTFTGTVVAPTVGSSAAPAVGNAAVALHRDDGNLVYPDPVMTNGAGEFAVALPAGEPLPFDGYFEVTAAGFLDTFSHLVLPTRTDPQQRVSLLSETSLADLAASAGTTQTAHVAMVVATIVDDRGNPVAGTTIAATGATACYSTDGAHPMCAATQTDASGTGWIFSAPIDQNFQISAPTGQLLVFPTYADTVVFTPVRP